MTRDEWVVLPDGTRLLKTAVVAYRSAVNDDGKYELRVYDHGGKHFAFDDCTLAEFEALLFAPAPAAPDDYTRAGMAWAEAEALLVAAPLNGRRLMDAKKARRDLQDAFLRLYRERHGG